MKHTALHRMKQRTSHMILLLFLLGTTSLPVGYAAIAVTPVQAAGAAWYDGLIQYSTITNCVSIIQGSPYQENGAGTYVGFLADPDAGNPSPNAIYYIHVVIAGMGNACSGMRAYIDISLPANTTFAIDAVNKVYCFYDGVPLAPASDCPQSLPPSAHNAGMFEVRSPDSAHAYTWPIPIGRFLEIQIPVRSSTALTNSMLQAQVWMLDGNSNPWLAPQQGVYVFSSQPTILYPNPSTTSITSTTAHSAANLFTHGIGGTGYFDLGTDTSYSLVHEAVIIPGGGNGFAAWDDWGPPPLLPNTLYHWRFTFTPSGGQTVMGGDQTFRTLPSGTATVGSGMTGSCTEAALNSALAAGGQVTFSCGPLPVSITLTGVKTINSNVNINGGNLVTLSTNGSTNHFNVQPGAHLTLSQIELINGSNSANCGGSIHVLGNGQLTLTKVDFNGNNTTSRGGAVCIDANGSADMNFTTFTNNHAQGGGGVFNWGTLAINHSVFTTNASTIHGGALQNFGAGTVSETTFNQNTAVTNGGAIDSSGTLTLAVNRGSFNSNTAGYRGGAINEYLGILNVTESSFTTNHSDGYGGGIANDQGTVSIKASEFSGNTAKSVGGGLRANGTTSVTNSTFSGNHADISGGGIENSEPSATLALLNNTLTNNSAGTQGGNLFIGTAPGANITLKNTLLSAGSPNNCDHTVLSQGHNLESADSCGLTLPGDRVSTAPKLGPYQNNGGITKTYSLLEGSPAIDAGANSGCPAADQRGAARPTDGDGNGTAACDIGAFEKAVGAPPTPNLLKLFIPMVRK